LQFDLGLQIINSNQSLVELNLIVFGLLIELLLCLLQEELLFDKPAIRLGDPLQYLPIRGNVFEELFNISRSEFVCFEVKLDVCKTSFLRDYL